MFAHIGGADGVAATGDKTAGHIGCGTQNGRNLCRRAARDQLDVAVLRAVAADGGLNHHLRAVGKAKRTHVAGGMGAQVADRIDHLRAEQRRGQPGIDGRRHAVLADNQPGKRLAEGFLQQRHHLHIIAAEHLPCGQPARRANGGGGGNPGIVGKLADIDQLRPADSHRHRAELAPVLDPTTAATGENRPAAYREFHVLRRQNTSHRVSCVR